MVKKDKDSKYLGELVDFSDLLKTFDEVVAKSELKKTKGQVDVSNFFPNNETLYQLPRSAKNNIKTIIGWIGKYGKECKGITPMDVVRCRNLTYEDSITFNDLKDIAKFNSHRSSYEKAKLKPEYKTKPWGIPAVVRWLSWGGTSGIDWAINIVVNKYG